MFTFSSSFSIGQEKCFRVIIVIPPLPSFQGGVDDSGAASVRAIMHWKYRTSSRGNNSILHNLYDLVGPRMHDYITFCGLRAYGRLYESGHVSSSQVYVHSKIMIIDDNTTLIGSENINNRSLLGSRDSEIGVLIEENNLLIHGWEASLGELESLHRVFALHCGLNT